MLRFSNMIVYLSDESSPRENADPSSLHLQPLLGKELNRRRVNATFLGKHSRCQAGRIVVFGNRDRALHNNRPMIIFIVREMGRAASDLDPGIEDGLVDMQSMKSLAAEGGDERRMNVHHPIDEIRRDVEQMQKSRQQHQICLVLAAFVKQGRAEVLARSNCLTLHNGGWDAKVLGSVQSVGLGVARQDADNLTRQTTSPRQVEQVL